MLRASLAPFAFAVLASAIATLLVRSVARHRGVVSSPRADRWHPKPTPLLGGVALWLATLGTTLFILPIAAAATGMCALGLLDEAPRAGSERHPVAFTQQLSTTLLALPTREP